MNTEQTETVVDALGRIYDELDAIASGEVNLRTVLDIERAMEHVQFALDIERTDQIDKAGGQ